MVRTLLWVIAGVGLGLIIHMSVILSMPVLAFDDSWARISTLNSLNRFTLLDDVSAGEENLLQLDPELIYAVCQINLEDGPGVVNGILPDAFWSVSVFDASGRAVYGTTNRSGIGQGLQLGIFNPEQTKLLARQQLEVTEGLLIVESDLNDVFVTVRLAPPHTSIRARFRTALADVTCGNA